MLIRCIGRKKLDGFNPKLLCNNHGSHGDEVVDHQVWRPGCQLLHQHRQGRGELRQDPDGGRQSWWWRHATLCSVGLSNSMLG